MNKIVTAEWCGPCKMLKGEIKNAKVEVEYIDADSNTDFCNKLGIKSIPTLITSEKEIITSYPEILKKLNIL
jgi:thioredoxin-like negative regulator of GroEL